MLTPKVTEVSRGSAHRHVALWGSAPYRAGGEAGRATAGSPSGRGHTRRMT